MKVLCVIEIAKGKITGASKEAITAAKNLGEEVEGVLLGHDIGNLAEEAIKCGLKKVYKVDSPELAGINTLYHTRILGNLINEINPSVILAGASLQGQEMMPRLAARLGTLCLPLKGVRKEGEMLVGERPLFEEKLIGEIQLDSKERVIASILSGNNPEAEPDDSMTGEVVEVPFAVEEEDKREEFVEEKVAEVSIDITKAKLIVSGGRGAGSKEKFQIIFDAAKALGGEVGASRAVVDVDWVAYDHEVGQTGKIVTPDFYIACGISGAMQHLIGMRNSKTIIAVNTDNEAPILEVAHFAIIADLHLVLPELMKRFS
ncbi:MAG: electron transfer flavoprotein subunit alpha/FixB family protein [Candidatus Odinarchaeota archaeon]